MFYIAVLTAYVTIRNVMGHWGELIYFVLLIAAITTTVCAEVIAVASILVYDVYNTYIRVGYRLYFLYTSSSVRLGRSIKRVCKP